MLEGIFDSIILRDATERAQVRNDASLLRVTNFLMSEIGNTISADKIAGILEAEGLKSGNNQSVTKYLELLSEAFIFYQAKRYDI